jgi:hypothetical protein
MIFVWDNGREYSDHAIHFVQLDEQIASKAMIEALMEAKAKAERADPSFIIMWAEKIDWRRGYWSDDLEPLWMFLDPSFFIEWDWSARDHEEREDGQPRAVLVESLWRGPVIARLWRHWHEKLKPLGGCHAALLEWNGQDYEQALKLIGERLRLEGWL